ncbi:MAG: transporter permease [Haloplasmataceae bacterium]|jgi:oligopeptide transport system permease protein|nr:transporter permease [Haloplasmataceae bacterium]
MDELAQKKVKNKNPILNFLIRFFKPIYNFFRKPLVKYIFIRTFDACITLFLIVTAVFLLLRMVPKERFIDWDRFQKVPAERKEQFKIDQLEKYGLNDPIHEQLFNYYNDLNPFVEKELCVKDKFDEDYNVVCTKYESVRFNLGKSLRYKNGAKVTDLIAERFPVSFKLSMLSLVVTYALAVPLGVYMAKNKGGLIDKLGNGFIVFTNAVPSLIFYYVWLIVGMKVFNFPSIFEPEDFRSWIIPVWALSFVSIAGTAMWVRRYMVDEINSDYVKFARSKGLSESAIMFKHVFRNAVVPLIRTIPSALIFAVVGSYFVEMLWNIPGSGGLLVQALTKVDNPLVQGLTIIYAAMSMVASLLGDLVTVFFDPRISLTKNK